jgi:hypothetical protein
MGHLLGASACTTRAYGKCCMSGCSVVILFAILSLSKEMVGGKLHADRYIVHLFAY